MKQNKLYTYNSSSHNDMKKYIPSNYVSKTIAVTHYNTNTLWDYIKPLLTKR